MNFVAAGALPVAFTWTSKTKCPATMAVFAVLSMLNVAGLPQEVPKADTPAEAPEKPLSVARSPAGKFIADPNWAW